MGWIVVKTQGPSMVISVCYVRLISRTPPDEGHSTVGGGPKFMLQTISRYHDEGFK